jgi:hypothetical protein
MTVETKEIIKYKLLQMIFDNVKLTDKEADCINYYSENYLDNHGTYRDIFDNLIYKAHENRKNKLQ